MRPGQGWLQRACVGSQRWTGVGVGAGSLYEELPPAGPFVGSGMGARMGDLAVSRSVPVTTLGRTEGTAGRSDFMVHCSNVLSVQLKVA